MKQLFAPPNKYVWDQWFIKKDGNIYAFFAEVLKEFDPVQNNNSIAADAPTQKNLEKAIVIRNDNIAVGCAMATDDTLLDWEYLGTALEPGTDNNNWDSQACWSGSVIQRKDGTYAQLYTGRRKKEGEYWIQRIGLATSDDLVTWHKHPDNPILETDTRYYEMDNIKSEKGNIKGWRDPFLFQDPQTGKIYATITANKKNGGEHGGVLALAEALNDDLSSWKIHPPIISPGVYAEMEASQVINHNGIWYIFFFTWLHKKHPEYAKKHAIPGGGMQCYYSDNLFGEFKPVNGGGSVTNNAEEPYGMYCAKLIDQVDENIYRGLGWVNLDEHGNLIGTFSHPFLLEIKGDRVQLLPQNFYQNNFATNSENISSNSYTYLQ